MTQTLPKGVIERNHYFRSHPGSGLVAFMVEQEERHGREIYKKSTLSPSQQLNMGYGGETIALAASQLGKEIKAASKQGWVEECGNGSRAKGYYKLTSAGRAHYQDTILPQLTEKGILESHGEIPYGFIPLSLARVEDVLKRELLDSDAYERIMRQLKDPSVGQGL